jgi:hypothetical protein
LTNLDQGASPSGTQTRKSSLVDEIPVTGERASEIVWGEHLLSLAVCPNCDARFLVPTDVRRICPNCFLSELTPITAEQTHPPLQQLQPELVEPFHVTQDVLHEACERFASSIPFSPPDLNTSQLLARLKRVFLPAWLLDATTEARWWAEAGFDYQVVSHIDTYDENAGGWVSQEVSETRTRWEPRLGGIHYSFPNVVLPAMEEEGSLMGQVYQPDISQAVGYSPASLNDALVRVPERSQEDVWADAPPRVQQLAGELCRRAAGADHLRLFRWQAQYPDLNWTLLLSPLYATYYLADDGTPQPVFFHGRNGTAVGRRTASVVRAKRLALIVAIAAAVMFTLGAALMLVAHFTQSAVLPVGALLAIIGLMLAMIAPIPMIIVWYFNRQQRLEDRKSIAFHTNAVSTVPKIRP